MRQTREWSGREQMDAPIAVVMGIFARGPRGVMLLGPRFSGRIYGSVEQNALQGSAGSLAIAIDNAQLFTEVQNARFTRDLLQTSRPA